MRQIKNLAALLTLCMMVIIGVTSCEKDEPGSSSSHDYYSAYVSADPGYYWVIDMDYKSGPGYDGFFKIMAWTEDGKKMSGKNSYSGRYQTKGNTIYVTWDHQSMNTMWEFTSTGISMIGSSNPSELEYLYFRAGAPDFN